MTLERILLQTIKFDLQIEHPYSFLLKYAKCLKGKDVTITYLYIFYVSFAVRVTLLQYQRTRCPRSEGSQHDFLKEIIQNLRREILLKNRKKRISHFLFTF